MAFYFFKIKHVPFPKPLSLFYLLMITGLFSVPSPFTSTAAISFDIPSFIIDDSRIRYEVSAVNFPDKQVIQLTGNQDGSMYEVGRATSFSPMRLWDNASGKLTDFTTNFLFVIDSQNRTSYGDGLAFFLAPNGSTCPEGTRGGPMGLTKDKELLDSTDYPFVAVEFDIYSNTWDPPGEHVGIDMNSMQSVANVSWLGGNISTMGGRINEARINYNSTSHNLSVLFTGLINSTTVWQSLSYNIDLRDHLPEWVTFGFSASTGGYTAMHTIRTWNFSSTLEDIVTKTPVAGSPSPNPAPARPGP